MPFSVSFIPGRRVIAPLSKTMPCQPTRARVSAMARASGRRPSAAASAQRAQSGCTVGSKRPPLARWTAPASDRRANIVSGWGGAGAFSDGKLTLTTDYGGNLDALYDALGDVAEPTNLVLRGAPASDEMAAYLPRLTRVLEDAAAENRNVELTR